jgi:hypothetical protein
MSATRPATASTNNTPRTANPANVDERRRSSTPARRSMITHHRARVRNATTNSVSGKTATRPTASSPRHLASSECSSSRNTRSTAGPDQEAEQSGHGDEQPDRQPRRFEQVEVDAVVVNQNRADDRGTRQPDGHAAEPRRPDQRRRHQPVEGGADQPHRRSEQQQVVGPAERELTDGRHMPLLATIVASSVSSRRPGDTDLEWRWGSATGSRLAYRCRPLGVAVQRRQISREFPDLAVGGGSIGRRTRASGLRVPRPRRFVSSGPIVPCTQHACLVTGFQTDAELLIGAGLERFEGVPCGVTERSGEEAGE